ncbi:hypothetical protein K439DRAFT_1622470 [Ramaria rubella]|nr:hypothetical protein K439DRAFT_1622470 [Ramaria rubella]
MICQFHLELQQRNQHPNDTTTSHPHTFSSLHAVTRRIHKTVMDEFGDPAFNEFDAEASQQNIKLQGIHSASEMEINLQGLPSVQGDIGAEDTGVVGPVASGECLLFIFGPGFITTVVRPGSGILGE